MEATATSLISLFHKRGKFMYEPNVIPEVFGMAYFFYFNPFNIPPSTINLWVKPMNLPQLDDKFNTRLQSMDPSTIEKLYDYYGAALFSAVLRIVHTHELAEQVIQDTFIKAWHKAKTFEPEKGRLFTWLLNIARNTAIDATRTAHFKHGALTDNLLVLQHQPDEEASMDTDYFEVRQMVNQLDVKYSSLIDLIYFQGYTQVEVAESSGIPIGTIKTRLRHAIKVIRGLYVGDSGDLVSGNNSMAA